MLTEKQIRLDLNKVKTEAKQKGKKFGKVAESHYLTAIKTVQTLRGPEIKRERLKLINEIALINSKWDSYLLNFTAFKLKHKENHEKAVKKEFKKVYDIPRQNQRLKWINYVLEI